MENNTNANTGYNGYKNYESWNCSLWLRSDEACYSCWTEAAKEAIKKSENKQAATVSLMDQMREAVENDLADYLEKQKNGGVSNTGMFSDLLTNAVGNIDFYEVAAAFIEDVE